MRLEVISGWRSIRFRPLVGWKRRYEIGDGGARHRVTPLRIDIGERQQNEGAFVHPWMRKDGTVISIHYGIIVCDQIKIENASLVPHLPGAPELRLHFVKQTE